MSAAGLGWRVGAAPRQLLAGRQREPAVGLGHLRRASARPARSGSPAGRAGGQPPTRRGRARSRGAWPGPAGAAAGRASAAAQLVRLARRGSTGTQVEPRRRQVAWAAAGGPGRASALRLQASTPRGRGVRSSGAVRSASGCTARASRAMLPATSVSTSAELHDRARRAPRSRQADRLAGRYGGEHCRARPRLRRRSARGGVRRPCTGATTPRASAGTPARRPRVSRRPSGWPGRRPARSQLLRSPACR